MTWYMFSSILSLFRNVPESEYSECELTCGQRLFWIRKRTMLKMDFWNQNIPLRFGSSRCSIRTSYTSFVDWVPVSNCSCPHLYLYVVVLELETGSIRSVSFSAFDLCINTKLFTEAIVFLLYYQIKNNCTIHTVWCEIDKKIMSFSENQMPKFAKSGLVFFLSLGS